jgi:hypothetical protein
MVNCLIFETKHVLMYQLVEWPEDEPKYTAPTTNVSTTYLVI